VNRYLLDSTPLTAYLNRRPTAVRLIDPWIEHREAATSILSYAEVVEYLKGLPNPSRRLSELRRLLREIQPLLLTFSTLERYADLRRQLRPPYGPGLIGDIDTLIAATALERDLILVTTDSDFQRVPELKLMLLPR